VCRGTFKGFEMSNSRKRTIQLVPVVLSVAVLSACNQGADTSDVDLKHSPDLKSSSQSSGGDSLPTVSSDSEGAHGDDRPINDNVPRIDAGAGESEQPGNTGTSAPVVQNHVSSDGVPDSAAGSALSDDHAASDLTGGDAVAAPGSSSVAGPAAPNPAAPNPAAPNPAAPNPAAPNPAAPNPAPPNPVPPNVAAPNPVPPDPAAPNPVPPNAAVPNPPAPNPPGSLLDRARHVGVPGPTVIEQCKKTGTCDDSDPARPSDPLDLVHRLYPGAK
jgi:hypothetical protein